MTDEIEELLSKLTKEFCEGLDQDESELCAVGIQHGFYKGYALARKRVDELAQALRILKGEVRGTLYAHEVAIGYDHGNSNWRCLELALERAEKALELWKAEGGE
jgi:hypothetical protein